MGHKFIAMRPGPQAVFMDAGIVQLTEHRMLNTGVCCTEQSLAATIAENLSANSTPAIFK
jgi:hypothetical protein